MTVLSSWFLQTIGPALLPKSNSAGYEYYDVLGLNKKRHSHDADIRKAYRQLSLKYHPDKVMQRNKQNGQEDSEINIKLKYERIQNAYRVLSDHEQRKLYHQWQCSVSRYEFVVVQHGLSNPMALIGNLQHANFRHRFRLWAFVTLVLMLVVLLQPILIMIKVNNSAVNSTLDNDTDDDSDDDSLLLQNVPWIVIFIPLWILSSLYLLGLLLGVVFVVGRRRRRKHNKKKDDDDDPSRVVDDEHDEDDEDKDDDDEDLDGFDLIYPFLEAVSVVAGLVLLTIQFDRTLEDKWNWYFVSIPFYLAIFVNVVSKLHNIYNCRQVQSKMVSKEWLQQQYGISSWDEYELDDDDDETQQQRERKEKLKEELQSKYIPVESDSNAIATILIWMEQQENTTTATEEQMEALRVRTSNEYQAVSKLIRYYHMSIAKILLSIVPTIALIAAKLQESGSNNIEENVSWWIVFIPIWIIHFGLPLFYNVFVCCCFTLPPTQQSGGEDDDIIQVEIPIGGPEKEEETTKKDNNQDDEEDYWAPTDANFIQESNTNDEGDVAKSTEPSLATTNNDADNNNNNNNKMINKSNNSRGGAINHDDETAVIGKKDQQQQPSDVASKKVPNSSSPAYDDHHDNTDQREEDVDKHHTAGHDDDDREEFEKWQSSQEMDESEFAEKKMHAITGCCGTCFQIIILCLIVGKLEQVYDDDGTDGYNAFWILFPLLLVSGIVVLCCACCICCPRAEEEQPAAIVEEEHNDDNDETNNNNEDLEEQQQQQQGDDDENNAADNSTKVEVSSHHSAEEADKKDESLSASGEEPDVETGGSSSIHDLD